MSVRFWDPDGTTYGIPTYPLRMAPEGLATRRQLRARGLRPAGQQVAAQLLWRYPRGIAAAYLYRIDLAKPVRPMTPGRWRAHEAMMRPAAPAPPAVATSATSSARPSARASPATPAPPPTCGNPP